MLSGSRKFSLAFTGRPLSDEHKANICNAMLATKDKPVEGRLAVSQARSKGGPHKYSTCGIGFGKKDMLKRHQKRFER